jgi:peptide/nickel transport system substrate-binding protein
VPYGSGRGFNARPVGSGPFRLVRQEQDREVVLERNPDYWGQAPKIARVEFHVVADTTTRALELRKGSADVALTSLTADMIEALKRESSLVVRQSPGTVYSYLAMNLRDPILKDVRVRQALAYAIDRRPMVHYLWRDQVRPASSILPPQHWAYNGAVPTYDYNPEEARKLLDESGHPAGADGIRFRLTMKTSTEESTRLFAAVLQQQLREVGIALDIRTFEFATFYADVQKGAFQLYSLRWVGGNEDPDIFEHVFYSKSTPPQRANRGYYANARVDALIEAGRRELDQTRRRQIYAELQRIVGAELPYINLWYYDNVIVHSARLKNVSLRPSSNYDFLRNSELAP